MFRPPSFDPWEFDDGGGASGRRLLSHFNGLVVEAAEQVCLEWVGPGHCTVLISTRAVPEHDSDLWSGRHEAVQLAAAYGLDPDGRPVIGLDRWRTLLDETEAEDPAWTEAAVPVDSVAVPFQTMTNEGGIFGERPTEDASSPSAHGESHWTGSDCAPDRRIRCDLSLSPRAPHGLDELTAVAEAARRV